MHEGTTAEAPSHATRSVIVGATDEGVEVEKRVQAFAALVREARQRFSEEVTPLHLSDKRYRLVAEASGLAGLLETAYRMQEALGGATAT